MCKSRKINHHHIKTKIVVDNSRITYALTWYVQTKAVTV